MFPAAGHPNVGAPDQDPQREPYHHPGPGIGYEHMREFAFELALCSHLEADTDGIVSRQLGTSLHGSRVMDVVVIEPGPEFEARTTITHESIPPAAIESSVGPGTARYWKSAFDCPPDQARRVVDRAVEVGFFERQRRSGREYVRQVTRYPDWAGRIRGIENKPDLDRPGDLESQLRRDVALGLVDEVVLATASYVTRAHLNRLPDEVGVWRFDPEQGERTVVRQPTSLDSSVSGTEIVAERAGRTDVRTVDSSDKARQRRRLAERAYGKGWRVALPGCTQAREATVAGGGALPGCAWKGRLVNPGSECGPECDGFEPAAPPDASPQTERARRTAWDPDPDGHVRRQAGLGRFSDRSADSR